MIKESDAIEVFNLNTGTLNRLKNNGVFFIKDLLNLKYQDLFYMIAPVLDKDNISSDNISAEEFIYGSFRIILGDKDMELVKLNKANESLYYADIKTGEKQVIMPLKYSKGSWYMSIKK